LMWLRDKYPRASVTTELVKLLEKQAIFKCEIDARTDNGGVATGWGSETEGDFRDFIEKAETKAIGRACAALGLGTQFAQDHDYGGPDIAQRFANNQHAIVDAPVARRPPSEGRELRQERQYSQVAAKPTGVAPGNVNQPATERQVKFIYALAREAGLDEPELATWSQELYQKGVDDLNRRDAGTLIEALQRRRSEVN
jgi:hypothetical protein